MDRPALQPWLIWLFLLLTAVGLSYVFSRGLGAARPKEVSYNEFLTEIEADHLAEVSITERELVGVLKEEAKGGGLQKISTSRLPSIEETALLKELRDHQVRF